MFLLVLRRVQTGNNKHLYAELSTNASAQSHGLNNYKDTKP